MLLKTSPLTTTLRSLCILLWFLAERTLAFGGIYSGSFFVGLPLYDQHRDSAARSLSRAGDRELTTHNAMERSSSAADAMEYCSRSPRAVVITVWPSATTELGAVQKFLDDCRATVVYESSVPVSSYDAALLFVMALYDGEDWVETNCWYAEQPLPGGPPKGPYAGAKWKRDLCFRNEESLNLYVYVVDVDPGSTIWRNKYSARARLARLTGNPGNSCIHVSDPQPEDVLTRNNKNRFVSNRGLTCDDSYAYTVARALLHPTSLQLLNSILDTSSETTSMSRTPQGIELGSNKFRTVWGRYSDWLHQIDDGEEDSLDFFAE